MKRSLFILALLVVLTGAVLTGCKKQYYFNTGLSDPNYNGTMLEYFEANPMMFDTLVRVIKLAGLENYFRDSNFTFFAPTDSSIKYTYYYINDRLKLLGRDTLTGLEKIKPQYWRNTLMMYMFRGVRGLEDYPQLDITLKQALPGTFVNSLQGRTMNIGAIFTDARGLKYKGYRFLAISYVPNEAAPYDGWVTSPVASVNIKPKNGMIHALRYVGGPIGSGGTTITFPGHNFGFNLNQTWLEASYYGFE